MTEPGRGVAGSRQQLFRRCAVLGAVAGFLSGMFGVGGGILIVPMLVLLAGFVQRLAHGTSLTAVLPIAVSGVIGYAMEGEVDWPVAASLIVGAVVGAVIGAKALHTLPERKVAVGFVILMVASALRLLLADPEGTGRSDINVVMVLALVLFGVASGVLAALLGVGGGIVMVPAMVILFGIPAATARGTSLAVIIPTSITGTWRNLKTHNTDVAIGTVIGLAGVLTAFIASQIAVDMDERLSNRLFAALLLVFALRMVLNLRKTRPRPAA
jgi:uncharacterized membrane protein YfcA